MTSNVRDLFTDDAPRWPTLSTEQHIADLDRQIGARAAQHHLLGHSELAALLHLELLGRNESEAWREGYRQVALDAARHLAASLHLAIDMADPSTTPVSLKKEA